MENILQAFVTKKCLESREKIAKQIESVIRVRMSKYLLPWSYLIRSAQAKDAGQSKPHHFEDDTPWAQLASLALFRLFNEWQNQGYHIPNELLRAPDFTETVCKHFDLVCACGSYWLRQFFSSSVATTTSRAKDKSCSTRGSNEKVPGKSLVSPSCPTS